MEYKLTVVTTTYNHENYIRQALDGIVNQKTNFNFKVIVCDDKSTDSTPDIIKEYVLKYPNIVFPIIRTKNIGAMANFVETMSLVDTEYLALCDGDDFWTDYNKLQKQVDILDANKDCNICFHQTKIFFDDGSKEEEVSPNDLETKLTFDDLVKECFIPANSTVYRWLYKGDTKLRDVFPTDIVPGDYFVHLLHASKGKIYYIKEVMSAYRRHKNGMWWLTSDYKKEREFYLKYGNQYIKFYNELEREFNIPIEQFALQKNYMMNRSIVAYSTNGKIDELKKLNNNNSDLFATTTKDLIQSYETINYQNFSRFKKALYLILFDTKAFFNKLKSKFKK